MKRIALVSFLAAASLSVHAKTYVDNARVVSVDPQHDSVRVPRQECSNQWVSEPRRGGGRDYIGALLGGVVGALIGNQVGGGHGREAATAVGAVVGAFTGDGLAIRDRWQPGPATREVTTCRDVADAQTRIVGYQVTCDYRSQQFTTLVRENPGRFVQVRVAEDPVGR